jgi:hypothetical protein
MRERSASSVDKFVYKSVPFTCGICLRAASCLSPSRGINAIPIDNVRKCRMSRFGNRRSPDYSLPATAPAIQIDRNSSSLRYWLEQVQHHICKEQDDYILRRPPRRGARDAYQNTSTWTLQLLCGIYLHLHNASFPSKDRADVSRQCRTLRRNVWGIINNSGTDATDWQYEIENDQKGDSFIRSLNPGHPVPPLRSLAFVLMTVLDAIDRNQLEGDSADLMLICTFAAKLRHSTLFKNTFEGVQDAKVQRCVQKVRETLAVLAEYCEGNERLWNLLSVEPYKSALPSLKLTPVRE